MGANPVVADALDPAAVMLAIESAAPEVVIHELTSIPARPAQASYCALPS